MIAGPEVTSTIQEFEEMSSKEVSEEKCYQIPRVQTAIKKDVLSLLSAIEKMGNPFEEDSTDLLVEIMGDMVFKAVRKVVSISQGQYKAFVKERFQERTRPITETIQNNKLPQFKQRPQKNLTKYKQKVVALKNDCALFFRLYIVCQNRDGNLEGFFNYENQSFPPTICASRNNKGRSEVRRGEMYGKAC